MSPPLASPPFSNHPLAPCFASPTVTGVPATLSHPALRRFIRLAPLEGAALEAAFELDPTSLATAYWDLPSEVADRLLPLLSSTPLSEFDPQLLVRRLSPAGLSALAADPTAPLQLLLPAAERVAAQSRLLESCAPDFLDQLVLSSKADPGVVAWLWRGGCQLSPDTLSWASAHAPNRSPEVLFPLAAMGRRLAPPEVLASLLVSADAGVPSAAARTAVSQVVRDAPVASLLVADPSLVDGPSAVYLLRALSFSSGLAASQAMRAVVDFAPSSRFLATRVLQGLVAGFVSNPGAAPLISSELASRFDLTLPSGFSTSDRLFFELMSLPAHKDLPPAFSRVGEAEAEMLRRCLLAFLRASSSPQRTALALVPEQADTGLRFLRLLSALLPDRVEGWRERMEGALVSVPADERPLLARFGFDPPQRWAPMTRPRRRPPTGLRYPDRRQAAQDYGRVARRLSSKEEWLLFFGLLSKGLSPDDAALIAAD